MQLIRVCILAGEKHKKAPCFRMRLVCLFDAWQFPTLAWGGPTLPSALRRFTSEFGMGSGGTTALKPPGKSWCTKRIFCTAAALAALVKSVTYFSMLLSFLRLPPCFSTKSFVSAKLLSGKQAENLFCVSHNAHQNASGVVRLSLTGH